MASTSTSSAKITSNPNVQIRYVQSATPTAKITEAGQSGTSDNLLAPQEVLTQEEVQATPTIFVSPTPVSPIKLDFLNPRVFGVLIGLVFLWIYIKGLRKGK